MYIFFISFCLWSYFGFDQYVLQRKAFGARVKEQCQSFSFCSVNACRWIFLGVVLSCLMPCLCQKVLGNEKWKLFQQQLPPLQRQQQPVRSSSKGAGNWRLNFLIGFLIAGVLFSGFLYWYISTVDVSKRKDMLANMCDERARMLQDQFNVSMNHVHALAILVSTFHHGKEPSAIDQVRFSHHLSPFPLSSVSKIYSPLFHITFTFKLTNI